MRMRHPGPVSRDVRSQGPVLHAQGPAPTHGGPSLAPAPAVPGADAQLGHIFRNMRAAMRLTREAIARRLATSPATIEDLELGAVLALPHWPETVRIVRAYCELLRLDPEPLLWRLQQLLRQGEEPPAGSRPGSPLMLRNTPVREPVAVRERQPPRRRSRGLGRTVLLAALPAAAAVLVYLAVVAPALGYRVISLLPAPLAAPARAGLDIVVLYSAPRRDGLRWIDIADPRLRKADKLPTKAP